MTQNFLQRIAWRYDSNKKKEIDSKMSEEKSGEKKVSRFQVWQETKDFAKRFHETSIKEQRAQVRFLEAIIRKQIIDVERQKFKEKMKKI